MAWYALDTLEDTFTETKNYLWPFNLSRWLKLGVIVFFVGGQGNSLFGQINSFSGFTGEEFNGDGGSNMPAGDLGQVFSEEPELTAFILGIAAVVFLIILFFTFLSSVFEFVFYSSLHEKEDKNIALWSSFKAHLLDGLKYFAFRWLVIILFIAMIAILVLSFISSIPLGALLTILMIPLWVCIWFVSFAVHHLALPEMVVNERGFIDSLRQTYSYVRKEWKQAIAFLLVNIAVGLAASILVGIGFLIVLIILGIPLVLLGVLSFFIHPVLVTFPVLIGLVGLFIIYFVFAIPVQTYIYQWILNVHSGFSDKSDIA